MFNKHQAVQVRDLLHSNCNVQYTDAMYPKETRNRETKPCAMALLIHIPSESTYVGVPSKKHEVLHIAQHCHTVQSTILLRRRSVRSPHKTAAAAMCSRMAGLLRLRLLPRPLTSRRTNNRALTPAQTSCEC